MEWQRVVDEESGRPYYYNPTDETTQWEFPESLLENVLKKHGYIKAATDEGQVYFYSEQIDESTWDVPVDVLKELQDILGEEVTENEIKGVLPETEAEENETVAEEPKQEDIPEEANPKEEMMEEDVVETDNAKDNRINQILGIVESNEDVEMSETSNNKDFAREFEEMLDSLDIKPTQSVKDIQSKCLSDQRFWNVESSSERKKLINKFLDAKIIEERNKLRDHYKEIFIDSFKLKDVKYYTRYETYIKTFNKDDEKRYAEVPVDMRKEFFNEYVNKLRQLHDMEVKEDLIKQRTIIEKEMEHDVKINTQFMKILPIYEKKFSNMTKLDFLEAFSNVIKRREIEHEEDIEKEKNANYRDDRKAREAFKDLLEQMKMDGEIEFTARTKWYEFVLELKDKPQFIELVGHSGSSPIDYFWDSLDAENEKLKAKISFFKQELVNLNLDFNSVNKIDFVEYMKKSGRSEIKDISITDYETIYDIMKSENQSTTISRGVKREHENTNNDVKRQRILFRKN